MAIHELPGYQAKCDVCGEIYEGGEYSFWSDSGAAIDDAVSGGEWSTGTGPNGETLLACTKHPPYECRECDTPISVSNPFCLNPDGTRNEWACATCHSDCEHVVHQVPLDGSGLTPCCRWTPFELASLSGAALTADPERVNCDGKGGRKSGATLTLLT